MVIIIISQVDIIIARDPEKEPVAPTAPVSFRWNFFLLKTFK